MECYLGVFVVVAVVDFDVVDWFVEVDSVVVVVFVDVAGSGGFRVGVVEYKVVVGFFAATVGFVAGFWVGSSYGVDFVAVVWEHCGCC